jgi:hypothetical protein
VVEERGHCAWSVRVSGTSREVTVEKVIGRALSLGGNEASRAG